MLTAWVQVITGGGRLVVVQKADASFWKTHKRIHHTLTQGFAKNWHHMIQNWNLHHSKQAHLLQLLIYWLKQSKYIYM